MFCIHNSKRRFGYPQAGANRCLACDRGVALIVVLSLIVIVSLLLVAFVTVVSMDRSASASYGQSLAAEQIGQGAMNLVIADLRNEMGKDAPPDLTYPSRPLYTNVSSANILPQPVGTNSAMPSLLKISSAANSFTGTLASGTNLTATAISTAIPSKNGRYIDASRWSAPYLGSFPTNAIPNWVIMTRGGPAGTNTTFGPTGNTLNNPALSNTSFAIGRFAYAIYDVGGLLDITVAGHPTTLTAAQINQLKGTLAGADLSAVGITNVDALVTWRNAASRTNYVSYITNFVATNGFSRVAPGDTTFLSRQDLIKAAQKGIAGLTTNVLTNLTTFTREKNAPSWGPRATVGSPAGNTIDYAGLATNLVSGTNFFIPYVRHTSATNVTTYKIDGTATNYPVVAGDPIVSRRFPLDRLKWIGPSGPQNGGTTASIQACFGLLWNNSTGVWQYVGPTGSTEQSRIKLLPEVVAEHREPNFFELLQSGILSGSLALESQMSVAPGTWSGLHNYYTFHEARLPLHVFRIGASILSQYEGSNYPIIVEYNDTSTYTHSYVFGGAHTESFQASTPWQACGLENLPYLNMFAGLGGKDPTDSTATTGSLWCYLLFGVWNPHQTATPSPMPRVRLHLHGQLTVGNYYGDYAQTVAVYNFIVPGYLTTIDDTIELSAAALNTADPHALYPTDLTPVPGLGTTSGNTWATLPETLGGVTYAGYRLENFKINMEKTADDYPAYQALVWQAPWMWVNTGTLNRLPPQNMFNFWLEYLNPAGKWVPYNYHAGINDPATWITKQPGFGLEFVGPATLPVKDGLGNIVTPGATPNPLQPIDPPPNLEKNPPLGLKTTAYYTKQHWESADPRSLRFHFSQMQSVGSTPAWSAFLRGSIWSEVTDTSDSFTSANGYKAHQNAQQYFSGGPWRPAPLSRNNNPPPGNANAAAAYTDADGVQRIADSGLFSTTPSNANQWRGDPFALSTTRKADRPIILNRPFTSVGELGYVSRDYPWRTLDFFTANSADGGLLDIFTVNASDNPVQVGRVNLNSRNPAVLSAVLEGATADILGGSPLSKPATIAADLANFTATNALAGRDQIATKFVPSLTASDFAAGNTDEQNVKTRREGVARALADVGQTRTWNLMIDIVAQSGRYSASATSPDQFVVEGERRFWLHVAVDRFTGEVIDQQLEPVSQ